jgi:hypothetical protein
VRYYFIILFKLQRKNTDNSGKSGNETGGGNNANSGKEVFGKQWQTFE